ncbi:GNAT family N-acetyltransferase [Altericroceibacterium endophyticum]|uniref:GNAT family N-acetyltransferase n=1 Tax=Altericroceibacterium endophyticum TaxID=1808508 RepID=A0A6I4T639_9SPHN|nr:GNAT family N-acetyltransferase [Altericroceibacterium endophyticum]MXO65473.1 GNAT family N-acetyltransferase [Altericroceibacterium endophyticum]
MAENLHARILPSVGSVSAEDWDRLAGNANPFLSHAFLTSLEDSESVGGDTGWAPAPIVIEDGGGGLRAALPAYLKGHSQGEYVFDYAWADAWHRAGGEYYPKLQIAVPFTPATGPRMLLSDPIYAAPLLQAAQTLCERQGFSSAHATFIEPDQVSLFEEADWLIRTDTQFHWENRDYGDFDGFLDALASRKRKAVRKERKAAQDGVTIRHLTGADLTADVWDAFWQFYQNTGARKWGTPYLTRTAFDLMSKRMGEQILMVLAYQDGYPIAGALNFIGTETLFGRYWGCVVDKPFLHFELCYYQAIDAALERGLSRVEAGAQGGHKLARGYEPVTTYSAHWIADPQFRLAIEDFLEREREGVAIDQMTLGDHTPFRKGN